MNGAKRIGFVVCVRRRKSQERVHASKGFWCLNIRGLIRYTTKRWASHRRVAQGACWKRVRRADTSMDHGTWLMHNFDHRENIRLAHTR